MAAQELRSVFNFLRSPPSVLPPPRPVRPGPARPASTGARSSACLCQLGPPLGSSRTRQRPGPSSGRPARLRPSYALRSRTCSALGARRGARGRRRAAPALQPSREAGEVRVDLFARASSLFYLLASQSLPRRTALEGRARAPVQAPSHVANRPARPSLPASLLPRPYSFRAPGLQHERVCRCVGEHVRQALRKPSGLPRPRAARVSPLLSIKI